MFETTNQKNQIKLSEFLANSYSISKLETSWIGDTCTTYMPWGSTPAQVIHRE